MLLAQREGLYELTGVCRQRAGATWMSPAHWRCPGCAQHRRPPGWCWGSRVGSVPPRAHLHAWTVLSALCAGGSDSPWEPPLAAPATGLQCWLLPWLSLFRYNICSWKMYVIWTGVKKGLALFPETYLSLGQNSWLLFLDDSRKLLSNSKQCHVLAYVSPHLSPCQNVSFA